MGIDYSQKYKDLFEILNKPPKRGCLMASARLHSKNNHKTITFIINPTYPIDKYVNTHHFVPILDCKNTKNNQICLIILQISLDCVFMCFRYKRIENRWKMSKVWWIGRISPWIIRKWQIWSLVEYFWNKSQYWSLGIQKLSQIALWWKVWGNCKISPSSFKFGKNSPWNIKKWKIAIMFLWLFKLGIIHRWTNFGKLAIPALHFSEIR